MTRIKGLSTKERRYTEKWINYLYSLTPEAERHGTDAIIDAFHNVRKI
ncbi:MAG: hypothetical protein JJE19_03595 [Methanosarcinales archaeon]|nr:hypothetical protein [Methanosarcinales archaeon]